MSRVTPCGKRPREISLWEMPLRAPVGDTSWAGEMSDFHTSGGNVYVVSAQLYLIVSLCDPMDCVARQAPLCLGFFREEHWSGLPFPSPGDLPNPGLEPTSPVTPALQMDSLPLCHQGSLLLGVDASVQKQGKENLFSTLCSQTLSDLVP